CHIMLDELPYGNFVEIEGSNIETIHVVSEKLKLNISNSIPASYSALFEGLRQTLGLAFTDLTFENFAKINISPEELRVRSADE
ncbi:MAG TPA: hypothetical protein VN653_05655, partial [Anaerolineales bacterium]|nr:hypothetical protein [Anaerolineales bacterium]